jgi:tryptophan synthase alpha chain
MSSSNVSSRFHHRFQQLKQAGQQGFIPFTLLGWPDVEGCKATLRAMVEAKPAALELGLPFSDPVADGSTIQHAVTEALEGGYRFEHGLECLQYARSLDAEIPIGILCYYNSVLAQGEAEFFQQLKEAGADACLIADLPPEAAEEVKPYAEAAGIELIFIVSPLTSPERFKTFAKHAGAFIYVVSRLGITGTESVYDNRLATLIASLREHTALPLCVGFGISTPEDVQHMKQQGADGVITGSRIIQIVKEKGDLPAYLHSMVQAARG